MITAGAALAGRGPFGDAASDESALRLCIHGEPVPANDDEVSSAFALLASLLLDFRAVQRDDENCGRSPPPMCGTSRLTGGRARGHFSPQRGEVESAA